MVPLVILAFALLIVPVRSYVVTEDQVTFYLHKRDSRELQLTNDNLASVDATKNVRLIVHGWIASHNENWVQKLTNAYLQQEDCNVVQVDWTEPADEPFYVSANNTKQVGRFVGKFIRKLIEELSVPPSGVSLVGHSFGSHVSGFAGKEVKASGAKVGRITVTDPARQPFESSLIDESEKLTRDDGEVVVAVHSDIGKIGYAAPIGTIDFYPNGGLDPQPGCESYGDLTHSCSHNIVNLFLIESVENPNGFLARKCDSYEGYLEGACDGNERVALGGDVGSFEGVFYFETNPQSPYSKS